MDSSRRGGDDIDEGRGEMERLSYLRKGLDSLWPLIFGSGPRWLDSGRET